jgi:ADP-ribose pyrophosphatase
MLLSTREIYRGRVIRLSIDEVELPNGHRLPLEIVHHPGGAAVVALDAQRRVCLLRQWRHAAGGWVWELPAGKLEPDEPPAMTARRELAEEARVQASDWHDLGHYVSSPGVLTERIYLYLATGLSVAEGVQEDGEVFEVHWVPLFEALDWVDAGRIEDGKTGFGLLKAARYVASTKL